MKEKGFVADSQRSYGLVADDCTGFCGQREQFQRRLERQLVL